MVKGIPVLRSARFRLLGGAAVLVMVGIAVVSPTRSLALTGHWYTSDTRSFAGQGCKSVAQVPLKLPAGAFNIEPVKPAVGQSFTDLLSDMTVATVTALNVDRSSGRPVVTWAAEGSDDACQNPERYSLVGWETNDVDFRVNYDTHERAYSGGEVPRFRPRTVYFGAHEAITNVRWHGWGRSVAKGRGTYPVNDCVPNCAEGHFTNYAVSLRFSRLRQCNGRFEYLRLQWTFVHGGPPHRRRTETWSYAYACK